MLVLNHTHSRQFAMSHGSYDLNLGSEILILVGDIRSRSWPNIGGTYGTLFLQTSHKHIQIQMRLYKCFGSNWIYFTLCHCQIYLPYCLTPILLTL